MQWSDVINDTSLRNLPYKIELDEHGRIVMSPASNRHGIQQGKLVRMLAQMLHEGEIATECSIGTHILWSGRKTRLLRDSRPESDTPLMTYQADEQLQATR